MAELHEVLAVERSAENTAKKLMKESEKTFSKENLFLGQVRLFSMFDSNLSEMDHTEESTLETTVDENLDYLNNAVSNWFDVVLQKELANQEAKADIILSDGTVVAEQLPATFLLGLETKLTALRELYQKIPTLAPGIAWIPDVSNEKAGVYTTQSPSVAFKTEKVLDFRVVVEPTEHHPAQVKELQRTENIGKYETTRYSGMLTPVEKANRLAKIEELLTSTKRARVRANKAKINKDAKIGKVLLDFINKA